MKQTDVLNNLRMSRPDLFDLEPKQGEEAFNREIKRLEELLSTYKRVRRSYSMQRRYNETAPQRAAAQAAAFAVAPRIVEPPKPPEPLPPPRNKFEADIDNFFAEHLPRNKFEADMSEEELEAQRKYEDEQEALYGVGPE